MRAAATVVAATGLVLMFAWAATDQSEGQMFPLAVTDDGPPEKDSAIRVAGDVDANLEVQTHGPVHEAFAAPVDGEPGPSKVVAKAPPEPVPELPPELKPEGTNVIWIPGYWAWDDAGEEYLWVSGIWRDVPPGHTWVPGYWHPVDGGHQWVTGYWHEEGRAQVELLPAPPEPIPEAIPAAPSVEVIWSPGCWIYHENRYFWRGGHWVRPRAGWVWVSPCYHWTPAGFVFTDSHWDCDFHRRGCLFAPVRFVDVRFRPGWTYRPSYVVDIDLLFGSLFVRGGGARHYYFGDYYDARFARLGYTPWVDVRVGRYYDPMFAYYRWRYRDQPRWETDLRVAYQARADGRAPRPPMTLAEQIKMEAKGKGAVRVVASLDQVKASKSALKLTAVSSTEMGVARKRAEGTEQLRQARAKAEPKAGGKAGAKLAAPMKLDLPLAREKTKVASGDDGPPPRPDLPPPKDLKDLPKGKDKDIAKDKDLDLPKNKDLDVPKGKDKGIPKDKDLDLPKDKDLDVPKGKDKGIPKNKDLDLPKGKDLDVPKGKDKGAPKDVDVPKGRDLPEAKDLDLPKPKTLDLPRGKDVPKPPKDVEPPKKARAPKDLDLPKKDSPKPFAIPKGKDDGPIIKVAPPKTIPPLDPPRVTPPAIPRPPALTPPRVEPPVALPKSKDRPKGKGKEKSED